jgi:hypothetical protein
MEIWKQAEPKLGIGRQHFSLVTDSHCPPQDGTLSEARQLFEIELRGRAGIKSKEI